MFGSSSTTVHEHQSHKRVRILDGKRLEQEFVQDAKDRRIRPDAQREREHSHGGEAGVLQQLAKGEFEIVHGSWSVVSGPLSVAGQIPKPQTPSSREIPSIKFQTTLRRLPVGD